MSPSGSLFEIVDIDAVAAAEAGEVRAAGRRAHGDAKNLTWQAVSASDGEWAAELLRAALAGRLDSNELTAELNQRAQAGGAP